MQVGAAAETLCACSRARDFSKLFFSERRYCTQSTGFACEASCVGAHPAVRRSHMHLYLRWHQTSQVCQDEELEGNRGSQKGGDGHRVELK